MGQLGIIIPDSAWPTSSSVKLTEKPTHTCACMHTHICMCVCISELCETLSSVGYQCKELSHPLWSASLWNPHVLGGQSWGWVKASLFLLLHFSLTASRLLWCSLTTLLLPQFCRPSWCGVLYAHSLINLCKTPRRWIWDSRWWDCWIQSSESALIGAEIAKRREILQFKIQQSVYVI